MPRISISISISSFSSICSSSHSHSRQLQQHSKRGAELGHARTPHALVVLVGLSGRPPCVSQRGDQRGDARGFREAAAHHARCVKGMDGIYRDLDRHVQLSTASPQVATVCTSTALHSTSTAPPQHLQGHPQHSTGMYIQHLHRHL